MGFKEELTAICTALPETLLVTLMDHDGISIDTVTPQESEIDFGSYLVELTGIFGQVVKSAGELATGAVSELTIRSERLATVLRPVNESYFLALSFAPNGNAGKARYLLRIAAPRVLKELNA